MFWDPSSHTYSTNTKINLPRQKYPFTIGPSTSAITTVSPVTLDLYLWTGIKSLAFNAQINSKFPFISLPEEPPTETMFEFFVFVNYDAEYKDEKRNSEFY